MWEYHVYTSETSDVYRLKGQAMRAVRDLMAMGKIVTVRQYRVSSRKG
jgi:hypothetical protein